MTRPRLVAFSANLQRPSKTRVLVEAVAEAAAARAPLDLRLYDLVDVGTGLGAAWSRDALPLPARRVIEAIEEADALIVGSPVYKGSYTGLFKHLFDLIPPTALANKPVAIAATGGGPRHALVVEHAFRPLFGFFNALQVPTTVYGSDSDFTDYAVSDAALRERAAQAGAELAALATRGSLPGIRHEPTARVAAGSR
ncbi:FMN reductase [Methylobacterium dankookense]|uniref:FMN reductase (NADPH) n=1 Tax=Methylobacterium dankookense TaxID=560405 RepID=A0A564FVF3_9HYPH|nr:FMN reductase [Methylobacterium dankookense]GJD56204.1 NADH-dependent FMN reductase SfnF [Methylobacterium dankookense]VUF11778.1 FMN reductase (NADPH) [Methylobacterium dankookense]